MAKKSFPRDGKTAIMAAALVCTGIFEFLEGIEKGEDKVESALKAVKKTRLRGKAIQKASKEIEAKAILDESREEKEES